MNMQKYENEKNEEMKKCGDSRLWCGLVSSGDSRCLSYASVTSRVCCFCQHGMNCVSLSDTAWSCAVVVDQCSVYCAGVVRHIRCLLFSFSLLLRQFTLYTRLSVPDLRHCVHHGSRTPHVSISSRKRKAN